MDWILAVYVLFDMLLTVLSRVYLPYLCFVHSSLLGFMYLYIIDFWDLWEIYGCFQAYYLQPLADMLKVVEGVVWASSSLGNVAQGSFLLWLPSISDEIII